MRGRGARARADRPRDVPTYDHKPEMSAARPPTRSPALVERTASASGSSTSPTPTWSATPASIPAAVEAVETVDACLGERRRGGRARAAAPASSPPTTATPTTCSSPTARPNTAHSLNPVPLIVTGPGVELRDGGDPRRRRADGARSCSASPAGADDGYVPPGRFKFLTAKGVGRPSGAACTFSAIQSRSADHVPPKKLSEEGCPTPVIWCSS